MVRVERVEKEYNLGGRKRRALGETSFALGKGECLLITGASGAGKTTLLNLVGCQTRPSAGRMWLEEQEITQLPERFLSKLRRWKIGFIFQQFHLLEGFSVLENVTLPLIPIGIGVSHRRSRGLKLLDGFGLGDRADSGIGELSGGEQQRVAAARALINDPTLILADEPTSNIDVHNSAIILQTLRELKLQGKTVLISSHDPAVCGSGLADTELKLGGLGGGNSDG